MTTLPSGTVTLLFTDIEGSTRLLQEHGHHYAATVSAECLEEIACMLVIQSREETALRLAGAAAVLRETLGMPVSSPADQARLDQHLGRARAALGEEAFEVAYAEGLKLTQDEAAAEALHEVES